MSRPNPVPDHRGTVWTITTGRVAGHGRDRHCVLPTVHGPEIAGDMEVVPKAERDIYRSALQRILDDDSRDSRDAMLVAAKAIGDGNMLQNTLTLDDNSTKERTDG